MFVLVLLLIQFSSLYIHSSANYFLINCGSKSDTNLLDRTFIGDSNSNSTFTVTGKSHTIQNTSSTDTPLYQTARVFNSPSFYEFNINEDKGTYILRLHFHTFNNNRLDLGTAQFDVSASRITLLSNFSVQNNTTVIKEFILPINVPKWRLNFILIHNTSLAFVNAIELIHVDQNYGLNDAPLASNPSKSPNYKNLLSMVFQTVHRINVGGSMIDASNDTILWRNWLSDDPYVIPKGSGKACPNSGLRENKEEYYAPNQVYQTCREVDVDKNESSLAWSFAVKKNVSHLVRVHFCDIVSSAANVTNFSFFIYNLFNKTINPAIDKDITETGVPFYHDFVVDTDDSGYMNVSIRIQEEEGMLKLAYLNGLEIMELMKEPGVELNSGSIPDSNRLILIIGLVGAAIVVVLMIGVFWAGRRWKVKQKTGFSESMVVVRDSRAPYASPAFNLNLKLRMHFAEIVEATKSFDNKLLIGEGGFGKVYRGVLKNGVNIAVKRSESMHGQGLPEFQTEVLVLSKIRHHHLVSLIGYCNEGSEMILVYEFMEKGTLRDHLYTLGNKSFKEAKLSWSQRLEICIGAAKGLDYLHSGSDGGIIHRDVKSTNILLDENYVAKVADFGLSRSGPRDGESFTEGVKGSFGYLDPEYFRSLQLTEKSDVYSFGVVLLEVVCARPAIVNASRREEINLADWGMFWLNKGQLEEIIDPFLLGKINPNSLRKFCEVVEKCLKDNGADRPSMRDVFWDLEYALQLQHMKGNRNPFEDSTKVTTLELGSNPAWCLNSDTFSGDEEETIQVDGASVTSASNLFFKPGIDGTR